MSCSFGLRYLFSYLQIVISNLLHISALLDCLVQIIHVFCCILLLALSELRSLPAPPASDQRTSARGGALPPTPSHPEPPSEYRVPSYIIEDEYNVPTAAQDEYNTPLGQDDTYNTPLVQEDTYNVPACVEESEYNVPSALMHEASSRLQPHHSNRH